MHSGGLLDAVAALSNANAPSDLNRVAEHLAPDMLGNRCEIMMGDDDEVILSCLLCVMRCGHIQVVRVRARAQTALLLAPQQNNCTHTHAA